MAYVPGFDHDVFISYTHIDDNPLRDGDPGWVAQFHANFALQLQRTLSKKIDVSIFRDKKKLLGNQLLTDEITAAVRKSACLICVTSPRYFGAEWCQLELDTYWNQTHLGFGPRVGNSLRVFKAFVQDVPLETQPENLRDTLGFKFYDADPPKDFLRLCWPRRSDDTDQRYWTRLENLATAVAQLLEGMRDTLIKAEGVAAQPAPAPQIVVKPSKKGSRGTVYLAEVTDDLEDDHYLLRKELESHDIRVLPDKRLPHRRAEAEVVIREALAKSRYAIHLFSSPYGRRLEDDETVSSPQLQFELAREHCSAQSHEKFCQIAWIAENVNSATLKSPQREFLQKLEGESDQQLPVDVQKVSFERLKENILSRMVPPPSPPPKSKRLLFITGHHADFQSEETRQLIAYCKTRHEVCVPSSGADEERLRKQEAIHCKFADGLLIVFGKWDAVDVQDRVLTIRELAKGRIQKPLARAVYEGPPVDRESLGFESLDDLCLVDGRAGFDPERVRPFLERMERIGDAIESPE